ncbi:DNA/RNA non-specific endonuclease [Siphonobacter sp. BAB-5385]|uniref:DNA/RNA non-specific endonuclease n=1 Tax=Siphonobacter sp. BAB-5385 TaxID=1864822 RepID=UPI001C3D4CE2|nr:DNA/RNA non-specific endonuclease [Siphonobacter sp. BAB-5385]
MAQQNQTTYTPNFMEKLKQFVRTRGADYLLDKNISSIGIGYKCVDGKRSREVVIQFTVETKVQPEVLPSLGTILIPGAIVVDGQEVPTDVLERSFQASFLVVDERVSNPRKIHLDPIVPGISVSHHQLSAGTLGCIVYGRTDGTPYVLSNWHILQGPLGQLGDTIVQPGPHDDNRIERNRMGRLVRSHLGAAGDCAIASIETRNFDASVFELDVVPNQLGEPELGDTVMKSGRTSGVTHGIVTRVHTMAKINYGFPIGEQSIGGFEISLDPDHLPMGGELSQAGDSGSIWLFKTAEGQPSMIMAGLHFAGESSGSPEQYALACYPRSIFEKLDISLVPPQHALPPELGYNPAFLGPMVTVPDLSTGQQLDAVLLGNSEIIPYTHFSLAMSKSRRFAYWVAWNIDGGNLKKITRKNLSFALDPRLPAEYQVGDSLYANNRLDRGHIARRADLIWGTMAEAQQANKDSFFFTNITPQMDNFNQSSQGGIWGKLEDAVFEQTEVDHLKVSVIGGPVFRTDDQVFRGVAIPREFYKILAYVEAGTLKVRAFLLTQNLNDLSFLNLDAFKVYQVSLTELEQRAGFTLSDLLKNADDFALEVRGMLAPVERQPLSSLSDIQW